MCGRFVLNVSIEDLENIYRAYTSIQLLPNYNITPQSEIPALIYSGKNSRKEIHWFKWGLIPHWLKDVESMSNLINARAETIETKPSYKNSFRSRRCIIPASGFYEWQQNSKLPFYVYPKDKLFSFAGIWDAWRSHDNNIVLTCAIITVGANRSLESIHPRMPAMIPMKQIDAWLDNQNSIDKLKSLLKPATNEQIEFHAIDKRVNNPKHNDPLLIEKAKNKKD